MKKPLKFAAYSGLIVILLSFIIAIIIQILSLIGDYKILIDFISNLNFYATAVFGIFFMYGFIILGKKFNNRLLVVLSWISITFTIFLILLTIIGNMFLLAKGVSAQDDFLIKEKSFDPGLSGNYFGNITEEELLTNLIYLYLFLFIPIAIVLGIYSILFGVALIKISKEVPYAKVSGILNIIAGVTYFIFIGFLIYIAANIFEIVMFFKASKKFEEKPQIKNKPAKRLKRK